ncbi:DUF4198 domain-containing protein [Roseospira visakhapatnamensis]|uniref:Cobalt/nickel transport protein n=1 Tax=Roseospira visakhapatnamensis TaxID=390880 RepID=A0A7W6RAD6_9PROT|nr:DUF4198 domain-containing protein [Roseospira visakhapatnamensis]MBB4264863.1 cobalt/nickel transport protein [Roseospira visakhapatnamensis]
MIPRKTALASLAAAALLAPVTASAHFQLSYTPEVNIARPGDVPVKLIFWHPFENGHVMDMGPPLDVYMVHRGERIDLMDSVTPITFQGANNSAAAFEVVAPVKRSGDYVLVTVPAPYYEESEDIYIQQITKAYLNRNQMPTDWMEPQGLPTEIVPLNKPTNVIVGSTFSGQVLSDGAPVAGAEVEIEFMASEPDMEANATTEPTAQPMPGGTVVAVTDANGVFTFGIPKAGFWGFAALGSGPATEHDGKELSQDAVIWVRAFDMQ